MQKKKKKRRQEKKCPNVCYKSRYSQTSIKIQNWTFFLSDEITSWPDNILGRTD